MKKTQRRLTLHQPATYEICVPGEIGDLAFEWLESIVVSTRWEDDDLPVTVLTCAVDQAALHSLLRRLYSLGLPLISVICIICDRDQSQSTPSER